MSCIGQFLCAQCRCNSGWGTFYHTCAWKDFLATERGWNDCSGDMTAHTLPQKRSMLPVVLARNCFARLWKGNVSLIMRARLCKRADGVWTRLQFVFIKWHEKAFVWAYTESNWTKVFTSNRFINFSELNFVRILLNQKTWGGHLKQARNFVWANHQ